MALLSLFGNLTSEQMTRPKTIGGGDWSAKDLLGHIAFWEELALESLANWRAGRPPPTEASEWPGTDAANARNQEQTTDQSLGEVRARAELAHTRLLEAIQALSETEWQAAPFYPDARATSLGDLLGRVLGGSNGLFEHADDHVAELRAYVDAV